MKTPLIDPSDPRITAYALGEMEPTEVPEFERQLKESPEIQKMVEEIQSTSSFLTENLALESCPTLSSNQRYDILQEASKTDKIIHLPWQRFAMSFGLSAVAASLAIMVGLQVFVTTKEAPPSRLSELPQSPQVKQSKISPSSELGESLSNRDHAHDKKMENSPPSLKGVEDRLAWTGANQQEEISPPSSLNMETASKAPASDARKFLDAPHELTREPSTTPSSTNEILDNSPKFGVRNQSSKKEPKDVEAGKNFTPSKIEAKISKKLAESEKNKESLEFHRAKAPLGSQAENPSGGGTGGYSALDGAMSSSSRREPMPPLAIPEPPPPSSPSPTLANANGPSVSKVDSSKLDQVSPLEPFEKPRERILGMQALPASTPQPLQTLLSAQHFSIGGVGFAGTPSEAETATRAILKTPEALQTLKTAFQQGSIECKMYALWGLKSLDPKTYMELRKTLTDPKVEVATMRGCNASKEPLTTLLKEIEEGLLK